jgi:ABC-type dipeptide/oligopeptide/nickel transport system ATPase component
MKNIIKYKKGEDSFVRWIKKRIDNHLNFLCILEGETGSGKSYNALSISEKIDPEFDSKDQIAFTFFDLMKIINRFNGMEAGHPLAKKKYKVCIFDEAQTDLSNRDWQSKVNKLFNYLLSTFRHQNIILFFTSPYSDFVDSASMKLLHARFECRGWDKDTGISSVRPKILQYNARQKKFYEHSLMVIRDGRMSKMTMWHIKKPSERVIAPYEEMKTAFTMRLNEHITKELCNLKEEEGKEDKKELNPDTIQPLLWEIAQKGYKNVDEIADRVGVLLGKKVWAENLSRHFKTMRKRGYDIRQFKINPAMEDIKKNIQNLKHVGA